MAWYKEQIGPLPGGAWVAVVAGGLGIALYSRRHPAPAAPTVPASADLGPTGLADNAAPTMGGGAGSGPAAGPPPITTNSDWARIAGATLIAHGYDPLLVTTAIADYLAGNALDDREKAAIQLALTLVGPPPLAPPPPLPGTGTGSTPAPPVAIITPPTPPPPALQFFGSGWGPTGANSGPNTVGFHPLSGPALLTAETPEKGLDGYDYVWLSSIDAARAAAAAHETIYIQIAPGIFIPQTAPVPNGTAAEFVRAG